MDASDSKCALMQSAAGSHYRSCPHPGTRHGIVWIPPDDGQTEERRETFGGDQIAVEMPVRGKHGKPNPGFPPFPPPLEIPQNQRDFHIPTCSTTVRASQRSNQNS